MERRHRMMNRDVNSQRGRSLEQRQRRKLNINMSSTDGRVGRSSPEFDYPNMSDLRIVVLGKSMSENSEVGNFILGRAAFDSGAPPDVVERVRGRLKNRHVILINSPQLLQTNILDHQITQTARECVSLSDPGPHVIVLLLNHEQCSTEDQERVEKLSDSFSERLFQHTMVLSTREPTETNDILQEIIHKCSDRHFSLQGSSSPDDLLQAFEDIVQMNDGRYLVCAHYEALQYLTMQQQDTEKQSGTLNVVVCGSDDTLRSSISELILQTDRRSERVRREVELHGRLIHLLELPALFNPRLSEEEMMRQTLRCVSQCHPGVHVFLLIIPDAPLTDEDKAEMEEIQLIFGSRIHKHIMILIKQNSEHQTAELNEETQSVIESFGGQHHFFSSETEVSTLMENIEQMLEENRGEFYSKETFLETQMKKLLQYEEMKRKIHSLETHLMSQGSTEGEDEMRIVLLGKSGVGKSATGNTILGRDAFKAETSQESVTKESQRETCEINGRCITVIDNPGLFDTELNNEEIQKEISNCISMILPGPHVFIIVLNLGQRYTQEEEKSVKIIQEIFGENSLMFTMVLFTRGDFLKDKTIEQCLGKPGFPVRSLIEACGNRYHVFNNNQTEDRTQVSDLLEKIDTMVKANGGSFYSCKMFRRMEREKHEQQIKYLMDTVEKLKREKEEVIKKLEEEKDRMMMMMMMMEREDRLDIKEELMKKHDEKMSKKWEIFTTETEQTRQEKDTETDRNENERKKREGRYNTQRKRGTSEELRTEDDEWDEFQRDTNEGGMEIEEKMTREGDFLKNVIHKEKEHEEREIHEREVWEKQKLEERQQEKEDDKWREREKQIINELYQTLRRKSDRMVKERGRIETERQEQPEDSEKKQKEERNTTEEQHTTLEEKLKLLEDQRDDELKRRAEERERYERGKKVKKSYYKTDDSLQVTAYRKLMSQYSKWSWSLCSAMMEIENKLLNKIENEAIYEVEETDLHRELKETSEEVEKSMSEFFKKDTDAEILIQWKISFEIKINELQENIVRETKRKLNDALQQRDMKKKIDAQRTQHENTLYEKSKDLTLDLKAKTNDEKALKKEFNLFWEKSVKKIIKDTPPVKDFDTIKDVKKILSDIYETASVSNRKDIFSVQSYLDYVKTNKSSYTLSKDDDFQIRSLVTDVALQTDKMLKSFNISKMGYNISCIQQLTDYIKNRVTEHQEGVKYKLKDEFFKDLVFSIVKRANMMITDQHRLFKKTNDPVKYLKRNKGEYYSIFQTYCNRATSVAIFGKIICHKLKEPIEQSVYKKTARDLADEMRSNCESLNGNRSNLEKYILKTLAEEEDFDKYMNYIKYPRDHFKSFIRDEVSRYMTDKFSVSVLPKMKENFKLLQEKIMKAAHESTKLVQDSSGDVGLWLKSFTQRLSDVLIFSEKDLSGVKHDDVYDFDVLEDVIKQELVHVTYSISKEFNKETLQLNLDCKFRQDELLIDHFCQCCWVQCPFCGAVCTNAVENHHGDHSVPFHRVRGINGANYYLTQNLCADICPSLVASDQCFHTADGWFKYREYRRAGGVYAHWSISTDLSELPHWKWFVCRFKKQLEKYYSKTFEESGKIPDDWRKYSKQEAINSLNECF